MTPQAQQIAIAVACKVIRPWTFGSFQTPNGCLLASLPDYLNDLNEAKAYSIEWQRKATAEMVAYENQLSTLRREKAELWAALEEMHKCFFDPAENEPKPGTWGAAACDKATAILAATKEKEEGK